MRYLAPLCMLAVAASAQTFDAASIKPSGQKSVRGSEGGPGSKTPGRYTFGLVTIMDLVWTGYGVERYQVSSKLPLDQDRFDLVATYPPETTREQFRAMVRNLLAERFHLKAHKETRELSALELVVAKGGSKLKESTSDNRPEMVAENSMSNGFLVVKTTAKQAPLTGLVRLLQAGNDTPVVDHTGLTGKYDFTLDYAREMPNADTANPPAPILATAIQQQLGLQLISKKLPFDVVVVDSVDKRPTEN
jgi:uncharacterized protein (TIGR03435 family)